jgi:hypothetical protein
MQTSSGGVPNRAALALILVVCAAARMSADPSAPQSGTAKGVLSFGATTIALSHVLASTTRDAGGTTTYRVLVTNKPIPDAGSLDWDAVALVMAEHEIHGVEAHIGANQAVTRANVFGPQAAMGARLFEAPRFEPTALDGKAVAGRLATAKPIADSRLKTTIAFDVTFSAPIRQPAPAP